MAVHEEGGGTVASSLSPLVDVLNPERDAMVGRSSRVSKEEVVVLGIHLCAGAQRGFSSRRVKG